MDYKERFIKRFTVQKGEEFILHGELHRALAFMDEVVAEQQKEHDDCANNLADMATEQFAEGRKAERASLEKRVEGLRDNGLHPGTGLPYATIPVRNKVKGYNQALDHVLSIIRDNK